MRLENFNRDLHVAIIIVALFKKGKVNLTAFCFEDQWIVAPGARRVFARAIVLKVAELSSSLEEMIYSTLG
jgi:hypothetical protein